MAAPRMIPGRIYGGFGLGGVETLTPELLAILAGNLPPSGDGGVFDLFQRLLDRQPEFRADRTLRDFVYKFGRYAAALDGDPDQRVMRTVECFVASPDLVVLQNRLKTIFDGLVALLTRCRLQRIREAPLDEARLKSIRNTVEKGLLAEVRPGGAFLPITVSRTDRTLPPRDTTFGHLDRGSFTQPEMSGITFDGVAPDLY